MQQKMNAVASEYFRENKNPHLKNIQDLIILASIIEKEAITISEMSRVSAVYKNRLDKKMKLQSCPTVIYAKTMGKKHSIQSVSYKDLEIMSEYNTYQYAGLPKGPISCPGKASMQAAANPIESKELYFVSDGSRHFFSNTHNEHLAQIRRIRKVGVR
jgi:UPF0755 protein